MRMIPVEEVKSIDINSVDKDICPFSLNNPHEEEYVLKCQGCKCMAWYWTGDNQGCCALVYKPETIQLDAKAVDKMILEIKGGVLQNIEATKSVSVFVVDHDNLKDGGETSEARIATQPYVIRTAQEIDNHINELLSVYNN